MKEFDLQELIDDYLLGRIQETDLARLNYLRKSDPAIDLQVRQSIEAFRVLQYARYKELREELHQIDASDIGTDENPKPFPWVVKLVIVILSLVGIWIWVVNYFSPQALASRNFFDISPAAVFDWHLNDEDIKNWESACHSFRNRDYQSAIHLFELYADHPENTVAIYAKWNMLLARLGEEGPVLNWKRDINQFESEASEPLKGKAKKLHRTIDSPLYQIAVLKLSPKWSAFKPRLM